MGLAPFLQPYRTRPLKTAVRQPNQLSHREKPNPLSHTLKMVKIILKYLNVRCNNSFFKMPKSKILVKYYDLLKRDVLLNHLLLIQKEFANLYKIPITVYLIKQSYVTRNFLAQIFTNPESTSTSPNHGPDIIVQHKEQ